MADEVVERTDEQKAEMYAAILGSVSVIDNAIDDDNDFCNDLNKAGKRERVLRSAGYMSNAVAMDDWGDEDMTAVKAAIAKAKAY